MTVAPLVDLRGFGSDGRVEELPDEAAIRDALSRVGYGRLAVRMDPPALRKAKPSVAIDLSGIAKGYAADTVAEELQSLDSIRGCLVEIGGEIRVRGHGPHKEKWRLGIEAPTADRRSVRLRIALTDRALATSGDYRNFFEHDGVRYSHTLDPRTGHPVRHRLTSVSVVHHSAATADAWATALLVLGPEDGYELAERRGLAVCFMLRDGEEIEERMTALFRDLTLED
jgi:thiamine biosynthesis lipoprotein